MKWQVTGADRETGEDKTIEVEAVDEAQAIRRAARMGLLVASAEQEGNGVATAEVEPVAVEVEAIAYASPDTPKPRDHAERPGATVSQPANVERGTTGLKIMAVIFHLAGWTAIFAGWADSAKRDDRFKDDNAVGATANAAEELLRLNSQYDVVKVGAMLIIAALLCQVVAQGVRIQNAISVNR